MSIAASDPLTNDRRTQHASPGQASPLLIGTRGSKLALWQTEWVLERLRAAAPRVAFAVETIKTQGDRTQAAGTPLIGSGDAGIFVAELERALLERALLERALLERALLERELDSARRPMRDLSLAEAEAARPNPTIDLAVHSLKDLPSTMTNGLVIAAVTTREDARDALISREGYTLATLPEGATIATSSLRRQAQLLHRRPDLRIVSVRGNVDTRLRKAMASDGPDAMALAVAGLKRLGLAEYITEYVPVEVMVPAVGQGALAVEARASDTWLRRLVRRIDDPATHRAIAAERTVLAALGGGCVVPLGAHAALIDDEQTLRLVAVVATPDGARLVRVAREGPASHPVTLGRAVARELRRQGADEIIQAALGSAGRDV